MRFEGKRVLLTGASRGIGLELARGLASEKARLVISARGAQALEEVAQECRRLGAQATPVPADLSTAEGCRGLVEKASAALGGLDALVLNAGVSHYVRVDEVTDPALFEQVMRVNYLGPVWCTSAALPELKRNRGAIVVVSSTNAKMGVPRVALYAASKHALHGFFDALRLELIEHGVQVTLVCPGAVDTGLHAAAGHAAPPGAKMMSAPECARRILDAARRGRREVILPFDGKLAAWLRPFFPGLVDRVILKEARRFFGG